MSSFFNWIHLQLSFYSVALTQPGSCSLLLKSFKIRLRRFEEVTFSLRLGIFFTFKEEEEKEEEGDWRFFPSGLLACLLHFQLALARTLSKRYCAHAANVATGNNSKPQAVATWL